jgi:hypothetical protein
MNADHNGSLRVVFGDEAGAHMSPQCCLVYAEAVQRKTAVLQRPKHHVLHSLLGTAR